MTEDKQAIEAIAKELNQYDGFYDDLEFSTSVAEDILQTLTSLGYVKLAEQKLPKGVTRTQHINEVNALRSQNKLK